VTCHHHICTHSFISGLFYESCKLAGVPSLQPVTETAKGTRKVPKNRWKSKFTAGSHIHRPNGARPCRRSHHNDPPTYPTHHHGLDLGRTSLHTKSPSICLIVSPSCASTPLGVLNSPNHNPGGTLRRPLMPRLLFPRDVHCE
jgi:hypothetical protein